MDHVTTCNVLNIFNINVVIFLRRILFVQRQYYVYHASRFASLTKEGLVKDVTPLVRENQPTANLVVIEEVESGMRTLVKALGHDSNGVKTMQPLSADWPFVD